MRKKVFCLLFAVITFCSEAFSEDLNGVTIIYFNGSPLQIGTLISYQDFNTGNVYNFNVNSAPAQNPSSLSSIINYIYGLLNGFGPVTLVPGGPSTSFGAPGDAVIQLSSINGTPYQPVTQAQVPFDFGLSAVIGAGALAAVRTARKRRKEEALKAEPLLFR